jgi:hypothetical protein
MADTNSTLWRDVPGYPGYEVSPDGQVRSWLVCGKFAKPGTRRSVPRVLRPALTHGYKCVVLAANGKAKTTKIATIVAITWIGPRPYKHVVRHLDGNRLNDSLANLAYGTYKDNLEDARAHGTIARGETLNFAKLRENDVIDILKSSDPQNVLAARYGVSQGAISRIRTRDTWRHLKVE